MINLKILQSQDVLMMSDLGKLIKASLCAYYVFDDNYITVYGVQDVFFSTINRIVVPNTTTIRGTMSFDMVGGFTNFCRTLIPYIDIIVDDNTITNSLTHEVCNITHELETTFLEKRYSLNLALTSECTESFDVDPQTVQYIKDTMSSLKAASGQRIIKIRDRYTITVYSGFIPVNKNDSMTISVIGNPLWFLCKYEIIKKKAPAPIHVFVKYKRL